MKQPSTSLAASGNALALAIANPGALGTIDAYISAVNRLPVLSAERETELGRRLRDQEDLSAARELVLSHLRLVVSVARQYLGYGLPHADLIQEGNVGLMKAVKRFDPSAACAWCPSPCTGSRPRSTNTSFATGAGQGRHHQGAAQTVLQPAQHAPGRPDAGPGTGRPYRAGIERSPRGRQRNGSAHVRPRHVARKPGR